MPVPPLQDAKFNNHALGLEITRGSRSFFPGLSTATLGYNNDYLGPTLRIYNGQDLHIDVANTLDEDTTVHWHGLHVPAEWDGGPHQVIHAGDSWHPEFTVNQQAATLWYHPHLMGKTGEQVYRGLAGLLYIEDDFSLNAAIPKQYGFDDIPVILQDRSFYEGGSFAYIRSGHDIMHGMLGNNMIVNGVIKPRLSVPRGIIRLRLLNGSNASIYRVSFVKQRPFWVIASDGGFLPQPERVNSLIFTAGERYEILLDLSKEPAGTSDMMIVEQWAGNRYEALEITTEDSISEFNTIPQTLYPVQPIDPKTADRTRQITMETISRGGRLTINGKNMDMKRIDMQIPLGSTEIWEISNNSRMMMQVPHSMHLHDVQFQLLDRNGEIPSPIERGRKDTVLLMPGEQVRIISKFEDYTGIYMFHCHMLEHEDHGMMGQFEVIKG